MAKRTPPNEKDLIHVRDNLYRIKDEKRGYLYFIKRKCGNTKCDKDVYQRRTDTYTNHNAYCSNDCMKEHREVTNAYKEYIPHKEYRIDENRIKIFTGKSWSYRTRHNCTYCNKEIYVEDGYKNKFCSQKCKSLFHNKLIYDAMDNQDHPNFCYLLGLIAADGYLTGDYEVRIQLKYSDEAVLLKIHDIFGGIIRKSKTVPCEWTVWSMTNKDFVNCLKKKGITRKKSLTLNMTDYFNSLTTENKWHFLRGVWDGDGYVISTDYISCGVYSGSKEFITCIQNFIKNECNIDRTIYESMSKISTSVCYSLVFNGKHAYIILDKLYNSFEEEFLYLERKRELALEHLESYNR